MMKVGVEEWSENSKDEEGHLAKNKRVDKVIKIKAICHELCETVMREANQQLCNLPFLLATTNKEAPCSAMLSSLITTYILYSYIYIYIAT